jgi:hypothetical protein
LGKTGKLSTHATFPLVDVSPAAVAADGLDGGGDGGDGGGGDTVAPAPGPTPGVGPATAGSLQGDGGGGGGNTAVATPGHTVGVPAAVGDDGGGGGNTVVATPGPTVGVGPAAAGSGQGDGVADIDVSPAVVGDGGDGGGNTVVATPDPTVAQVHVSLAAVDDGGDIPTVVAHCTHPTLRESHVSKEPTQLPPVDVSPAAVGGDGLNGVDDMDVDVDVAESMPPSGSSGVSSYASAKEIASDISIGGGGGGGGHGGDGHGGDEGGGHGGDDGDDGDEGGGGDGGGGDGLDGGGDDGGDTAAPAPGPTPGVGPAAATGSEEQATHVPSENPDDYSSQLLFDMRLGPAEFCRKKKNVPVLKDTDSLYVCQCVFCSKAGMNKCMSFRFPKVYCVTDSMGYIRSDEQLLVVEKKNQTKITRLRDHLETRAGMLQKDYPVIVKARVRTQEVSDQAARKRRRTQYETMMTARGLIFLDDTGIDDDDDNWEVKLRAMKEEKKKPPKKIGRPKKG